MAHGFIISLHESNQIMGLSMWPPESLLLQLGVKFES